MMYDEHNAHNEPVILNLPLQTRFLASVFLWRYEPVRCAGKSDDWLTIFCSHNKVHCSEIPTVLSNLLCHYFFIELWHIFILWSAKMPNGGMPVFTLIATGWRYRKIFFYKKALFLACADRIHKPRIAWTKAGFGEVNILRAVIFTTAWDPCRYWGFVMY